MSETVFLQALTLVCATVGFLGVLRFAYSYIALRQERKPRVELGGMEERLARIEVAVESTAIEVERISESHRFMAKLMSDRTGGSFPGNRPERVITPH